MNRFCMRIEEADSRIAIAEAVAADVELGEPGRTLMECSRKTALDIAQRSATRDGSDR
jgi:hypothetical protein